MGPLWAHQSCLLSVCVFVQHPGFGSCLVASPHTSVQAPPVSSASLFLRASPGLGPSWGYLALEGHRSFKWGSPVPSQSPLSCHLRPPEALLPYVSGQSPGLRVRHIFFPHWLGRSHRQGQILRDIKQEIPQR